MPRQGERPTNASSGLSSGGASLATCQPLTHNVGHRGRTAAAAVLRLFPACTNPKEESMKQLKLAHYATVLGTCLILSATVAQGQSDPEKIKLIELEAGGWSRNM